MITTILKMMCEGFCLLFLILMCITGLAPFVLALICGGFGLLAEVLKDDVTKW